MVDDNDDGFLFTARLEADGSLGPASRTSLKDARRHAKKERERREARFRKAPFSLYGLPPSWEGGRFLGGVERGSDGGRERTRALSLVHGALVVNEFPQLVVETSCSSSVGGGWLEIVAGMVWEGMASSAEGALAELGRHGDPIVPEESDPLVRRTRLVFDIDVISAPFDVFFHGDEWVARAEVGGYRITVGGRHFDTADVTLVRIRDVEPYILGSRRFAQT